MGRCFVAKFDTLLGPAVGVGWVSDRSAALHYSTVIVPFIPKPQCGRQKYGYVPGAVNV